MDSHFQQIQDTFKQNVDYVSKLMKFDEIVQDFAIQGLEKANEYLKQHGVADDHPSYGVKKWLQQIKRIRSNESLKPYYQAMLNQCVVMLASYFASAVESIFTTAIPLKLESTPTKDLKEAELKVQVGELHALKFDLSQSIGELLIATQKNISFQDMQSISRAFSQYLNYEPEQNCDVNNIILALACRHALVHAGGIVTQKTINQISKATPRDIKPDLFPDQPLEFSTNEVTLIAKSMTSYITKLISGVTDNLTNRDK